MKGLRLLARAVARSEKCVCVCVYVCIYIYIYIYTRIYFNYEGWNFNSGNYLFTTDTK